MTVTSLFNVRGHRHISAAATSRYNPSITTRTTTRIACFLAVFLLSYMYGEQNNYFTHAISPDKTLHALNVKKSWH